MPKSNCQKIKLLKLMELLRQETDEDHPMKTGVICKRLVKMGISCDRRTLHLDMKVLNEHGFEVMSELINHERAFYVADRSFSFPELKILIDAVQAASFITDKKTEELISKIADLGGSNRAAILKSNIVNFNTRKHRNEMIYYNVDTITQAIQSNKKAIFYYYDLDENGKKKYRREGRRYLTEPVSLVFNEDNYYLISYYPQKDCTVNYRLDRMEYVEILDADISNKAKALRSRVADYTESVFKMYGGEMTDVTLQFNQSLIGVMYDKFGEDTKMLRINDTTIVATVKAQISPTFWGWLFQFGEEMSIIKPQFLVDVYKERAAELSHNGFDHIT